MTEDLALRVAMLEARIDAPIDELLRLTAKLAGREQLETLLLGMLAGYQSALIAVLRRLDERGALPAHEATAALDGVYALLTQEKQKGPQGLILRQPSEGLSRRQPARH